MNRPQNSSNAGSPTLERRHISSPDFHNNDKEMPVNPFLNQSPDKILDNWKIPLPKLNEEWSEDSSISIDYAAKPKPMFDSDFDGEQ